MSGTAATSLIGGCTAALMLTAAELHVFPARAATLPEQACAVARSSLAGDRLARLRRGFNLTGWLDGAEPRRPAESLLRKLLELGFGHVRLPVNGELLMQAFSDRTDFDRHLAELDRALDTLLRLGFAVSLDMHPGARFTELHRSQPEKAYLELETLWRFLARRYADKPASRLFFELLNEPAAPSQIWHAQAERLIGVIRRAAPHHTIIAGPADFQQIGALAASPPFGDANVVYAVHFYEPMVFTHQGMDWDDGSPLRHLEGVPFPAGAGDEAVRNLIRKLVRNGRREAADAVALQLDRRWDAERIEQTFRRAAQWSIRHRRPVIVNEFGVLSWNARPRHRAAWLRAVRSAAEKYCIGWTHWEFADGFGFVHLKTGGGKIDPVIVRALIGTRQRP